MPSSKTSVEAQQRRQVVAYFDSEALFWKNIYTLETVYAAIHRERRDRVLSLIGGLGLSTDARVLECGCGAGSFAVTLARRGCRVQAVDIVDTMVQLTRRLAAEDGVADRVTASLGDVHRLAFNDQSFDLVIAIGVLPWLQDPEKALREITRVLKPGGHVIVTMDNRWRLTSVLDPFIWVRRLAGKMCRRLGLLGSRSQQPCARGWSIHRLDKLLPVSGLARRQGFTLGFGPFTLLTCKVIPERLGLKLHARLQNLADRNYPLVKASGAQYIVLARKAPAC